MQLAGRLSHGGLCVLLSFRMIELVLNCFQSDEMERNRSVVEWGDV